MWSFFWANTQGRVDPQLASLALLSLRHRGPNFQAIALWDGTKTVIECRIEALAIEGSKNSGPVYFASGHTRLSVIDLSDQGNQPMIGPSGEILSFNGVIYNYIELREQLSADGVSVVSKSDSEVLLKWLCHHVCFVASVRSPASRCAFAILDWILRQDHTHKFPTFSNPQKNTLD